MRPFKKHLAITLLTISSLASAQQLDSILDRLQANVDNYRKTIPNFFADEHVTSQMKHYGSADIKRVTDSTFRLNRREHPVADPSLNLLEARELKAVDHVPVRPDSLILPGPIVVEGIFSNGVRVVSREMQHCFDYTLHPGGSFGNRPAIIIDFHFKPGTEKDATCSGPRNSTGTATFDATNLQPLRVEMAAPDFQIHPGTSDFGLWRWRADYTPVSFDGHPFWLPAHIKSRLDDNDKLTTWYFDAVYTNYHKLEVTSHILPADSHQQP